jgi:hypothetical protein
VDEVITEQHITQLVDQWILEEDLPARASLKPIRKFDGIYPESDEEREAYFDFLHWFITQENPSFQLLKAIKYDQREAKKDLSSRANLQLFPEA